MCKNVPRLPTMFLSIYGRNTITTQNCNRRGSKTCIFGAIFLGTLLVHWGGYFKNCPTFHSDENLMKDEFPDVLKRSNPNFVPAALCQQNGRKKSLYLFRQFFHRHFLIIGDVFGSQRRKTRDEEMQSRKWHHIHG